MGIEEVDAVTSMSSVVVVEEVLMRDMDERRRDHMAVDGRGKHNVILDSNSL